MVKVSFVKLETCPTAASIDAPRRGKWVESLRCRVHSNRVKSRPTPTKEGMQRFCMRDKVRHLQKHGCIEKLGGKAMDQHYAGSLQHPSNTRKTEGKSAKRNSCCLTGEE